MNIDVAVLTGEFEKATSALKHLQDLYGAAAAGLDSGKKTLERAVFLSEILVNYYTCLETLLFRVSQTFENSLPKDRWHSELLRKMTIRVPDIREAVLSDEAYAILEEFRKFRHFKRYYYSMDYDWSRVDYLCSRFQELWSLVERDLGRFEAFLARMQNGASDE